MKKAIPFHRTLERAGERGFVKTTSIIIAVLLQNLGRLRYIPTNIIVEINKSKMMLFPRKGAIHLDLFLHRKREPICTDYLMNSGIIKEGDVVLDVGANIGYYVLVESQLVGKNGQVYAIEPVFDNVELLKQNLKINNLKNVHTFRFAIGESDHRSKIYVSTWANLCAMKKNYVKGEIIGIQEISVVTVDTFLQNRIFPKLIRMDVEGYEYEIIKGMPQALNKNIRILVELHPHLLGKKLDEILMILAQNNFKVRFAVFEDKVEENKIVRLLFKKTGNKLPLVASNISSAELKNLINENPGACPNVVFQK